jgi:hypothetical protein
MWEPRWKGLLAEIRERRLDERTRGRVAARVDLAQEDRSVERELIAEMARAFSRATRKLEDALARLAELERQIEAAEGSGREALVAAFNRERRHAAHARWELVIHREALGLRRHDDLDAHYRIPPSRRSG